MIRVAVAGALGRMGAEVTKAVLEDGDLELAAVVDAAAGGARAGGMEVLGDVSLLEPSAVDVLVDFTVADAAVRNMEWAVAHGVHAVVGTTGIPPAELERIGKAAASGAANVLLAPNFAIGAVMMMKLSRAAAAAFDQCEIIEYHHRGKLDAPSGTALATARMVAERMEASPVPDSAERDIPGTRGGSAGRVRVHSVRLDGFVAGQEVIFGAKGQTLSIRHDTTDRSCFMPGVILAVKSVGGLPGLTIGLDDLI